MLGTREEGGMGGGAVHFFGVVASDTAKAGRKSLPSIFLCPVCMFGVQKDRHYSIVKGEGDGGRKIVKILVIFCYTSS